ncbi:MAG: GGDEF domain-containing protein [Butyrivibrio sp.]|nr:GGDEF domain-containing protein [Butyrivibrio sp.]
METKIPNANYKDSLLECDKKQFLETNKMLLMFHILFAIPELIVSPTHMFVVNLFSIAFYLYGFVIVKKSKKHFVIYQQFIMLEIMAYVFFAVIIFGWNCGFQYWLFSLICSFIKDYASPDKSEEKRSSFINALVVVNVFEFIIMFLITKSINIPFADTLPDNVGTALTIINAFLAFSAVGAFTRIYTKQMEYKYSKLHYQADYDQLTGLGNRYYMNDLLTEEEKHSTQREGYSVAMIDIDHFKKINDTYGHNNGDVVLSEIAKILSKYTSDNINVCRWGGEEFLLVSSHRVDYRDFQTILESVRKEISTHLFLLDHTNIHCTVSVGAAHFYKGLSTQDIIESADNNLYVAKQSGRNKLIA